MPLTRKTLSESSVAHRGVRAGRDQDAPTGSELLWHGTRPLS
jgi:hypothetical protein